MINDLQNLPSLEPAKSGSAWTTRVWGMRDGAKVEIPSAASLMRQAPDSFGGSDSEAGEGARSKHNGTHKTVWLTLKVCGMPMTTAEVAIACGISKTQAHNALQGLVVKGSCKRTLRGESGIPRAYFTVTPDCVIPMGVTLSDLLPD